MTEQEAAIIFTLIPGAAPALMRQALALSGNWTDFFHKTSVAPALDPLLRYYHQHSDELAGLAKQRLCELHDSGIALLPLASPQYPELLREIHRPPPLLYVKGDPQVLALPQVAIIGSRRASRGGIEHASSFAEALARCGFVVTSGMALGIDGAAHRGALKSGRTVAVLGCGVDVVYPTRHRELYEQILASGSTLVSEFAPGTPPLRQHFPQRNRIISGLSMGVLVVEAAAQSGSLITARLAMEQGREVFAIPGSIQNPAARGCHQLIREGATLTESLEDIVSQLGGMLAFKAEEVAVAATSPSPLGVDERKVFEAIGFDPIGIDRLCDLVQIDMAALNVALVTLEIAGLVENSAGQYRRIR